MSLPSFRLKSGRKIKVIKEEPKKEIKNLFGKSHGEKEIGTFVNQN